MTFDLNLLVNDIVSINNDLHDYQSVTFRKASAIILINIIACGILIGIGIPELIPLAISFISAACLKIAFSEVIHYENLRSFIFELPLLISNQRLQQ